MSINREIWKGFFTWSNLPNWPCPTCGIGILEIEKEKSNLEELPKSKRWHGDDNWEPSWIESIFFAIFRCNNKKCGEIVTACGKGTVQDYWNEDGEVTIEELIQPKYFQPHLNIFHIVKECPDSVRGRVEKAFELFFGDPGSAANHLRSSIEEILNDQVVPKTKMIKKQRRMLSLHQRIESYNSVNPKVCERLLAIKWLGNTGSHSTGSTLNHDDVLDSFEIIETVLEDLYSSSRKKIERRVREINKRKGRKKRATF